MKLNSIKQVLIVAKSATIALILIVAAALLLSNCSVQSHYLGTNERIKKVVVYCGQLENITQATKRLSLIKTDKTEFFVWGFPEISEGENLHITFMEENIMPGMSVKWVPYLIFKDQKCKVNEDYTDEIFYTQITYANLECIRFSDL